jgi:rRNA maturation RNase YbeY
MLDVETLSIEPIDINVTSLNDWIGGVIAEENLRFGDITIVLCTDDELLDVNVRHLNHDYYTDIITFDYCEGDLVSGDLFVSVDRVLDNANQMGVSFSEELSRVFVHGVLHLCGYGDKTDEEVVTMREKEDFYLNKL